MHDFCCSPHSRMGKLMILSGMSSCKYVFGVVDFCSDCCCFGSLLLQVEPGEGKKDAAKETGKGEIWREASIIDEVVLVFEFFFG
jgi:hypothetical protein